MFKKEELLKAAARFTKERMQQDIEFRSSAQGHSSSYSSSSASSSSYINYSSPRKQFDALAPANFNILPYASANKAFDTTRLEQKEVMWAIQNSTADPYTLKSGNETPLRNIVANTYSAVGMLQDKINRTNQATCFLISENLALLTRHSLENEYTNSFCVTFGYFNGNPEPPQSYNIYGIVEEDEELDYAIILLENNPGLKYGFLRLANEPASAHALALLHYPLGKPLKVSVHAIQHIGNAHQFIHALHDSDFISSGGPYIRADEYCVALHLGTDIDDNFLNPNLIRYGLEIATIKNKHPNSILNQFILPNKPPLTFLPYVDRPFLEVEMKERRKAQLKRKDIFVKKQQAAERAIDRTKEYSPNEYEVMSVRDLACHFPAELGMKIFSGVPEFTHTNKTNFINHDTGWYVCHDNRTQCNTVTDNYGNHVSLNRELSRDGKGKGGIEGHKFHFRNKNEEYAFTPSSKRTSSF